MERLEESSLNRVSIPIYTLLNPVKETLPGVSTLLPSPRPRSVKYNACLPSLMSLPIHLPDIHWDRLREHQALKKQQSRKHLPSYRPPRHSLNQMGDSSSPTFSTSSYSDSTSDGSNSPLATRYNLVSPPSQDASSGIRPVFQRRHSSPALLPRCPKPAVKINTPYTTPQVHCIQYLRDDRKLEWTAVAAAYNAIFPSPPRSKGALECRYYRAQYFAVLDEQGNYVLDERGNVVTHQCRVRERKSLAEKGLETYICLVDRCPNAVKGYGWTTEESKRMAGDISEYPFAHSDRCASSSSS
jgi:hypothetical protein